MSYNEFMRMILWVTILWSSAWAQDERFVRQYWAKKKTQFEGTEKRRSWVVRSPLYQFDLNGDKREEYINIVKRDAEDWLFVYDERLNKIYEFPFQATGSGSKVYRIKWTNLSKRHRLGLIYYYEGASSYLNTEGQARLYFLMVENGDLGKVYMTKGPAVYEEKGKFKGHYHLRHYDLSLFDFNKDGTKEIQVVYGPISRIYFYLGSGKWTKQ